MEILKKKNFFAKLRGIGELNKVRKNRPLKTRWLGAVHFSHNFIFTLDALWNWAVRFSLGLIKHILASFVSLQIVNVLGTRMYSYS